MILYSGTAKSLQVSSYLIIPVSSMKLFQYIPQSQNYNTWQKLENIQWFKYILIVI